MLVDQEPILDFYEIQKIKALVRNWVAYISGQADEIRDSRLMNLRCQAFQRKLAYHPVNDMIKRRRFLNYRA